MGNLLNVSFTNSLLTKHSSNGAMHVFNDASWR